MGRAATQSVEEFVASLPADEQELARHILLGDVNQKTGRPVGFHHAPNGVPPPGRRIDEILDVFPDGSYSAVVSFWDPERGWVKKGKDGKHTMFPDHWSREEVMAAGREAYKARVELVMRRWRSRDPGLPLGGYHRKDGRGPATFFPDHER